MIVSEPTDSLPQQGGYGHPALKVEYSQSQAVGAELGLIAASRAALKDKAEAVKRFARAYKSAEAAMIADRELFAQSIQRWTGLESPMAHAVSTKINLGGVLDTPQLVRLSAFMKQVDIIQKDVAADITN